MTGDDLKHGRRSKGWTQEYAAARLGVSQPYLALMERGARRVPPDTAYKAVCLYKLSPTVLPVSSRRNEALKADQQQLASDLGGLGYPGFAYLSSSCRKNPAEVLFTALSCTELDSRVTEALPWVLLHYPDLDWNWLLTAVKTHDLQNRLGFLTSLARTMAQRNHASTSALLAEREAILDRARLVREDTLCRDSLSEVEKRWLREHRPEEARHWNLLTDLQSEHLSYAA
jgi:transcriptional regulator with XRE-family HTH domain